MTLRETIRLLQKEGHSISYYVRRDGGVLIKSIDGVKYAGAQGNIIARTLTGQTLSVKREAQLQKITYTGKRASAYINDREIKKQLQRVQRKWNKSFPHKRGEKPEVGLKTAKKVKWSLEHRGREETMRLLSEAERYASGKAYSKNIEHLMGRIGEYIDKAKKLRVENYQALIDLNKDISDNAWKIDEESILKAYEELYKLNDGIPPEEVARQVKRILKI